MRVRHVIYAGPSFAGRSTSLEVLFPESQHALGMRRFAGGATDFEFGGDHVRVATDNLGSRWFPSLLAARQAEEPGIRARIERLVEFLPVLDGVVFVADSQPDRLDASLVALEQLLELMRSEGVDPDRVPFVFQLNKRDLRDILGVDALRAALHTPRCAHVESVASFRHGVHRALATVLALADGGQPELRDDTCRESIRLRDDGLGLTLAGPAAVAAIWPKELLGAFAVKPGRYALARIGRILECDGLSGATRIPALIGGRARLVGAEVVRVELLRRGTRHPFRVLLGTRVAVEAAEQHLLPQESYAEAQRRGIAVLDDRSGFRPATIGALAIVAATGAPWIGFDADGAIVEIGAVEPHHDDVAERSPALSPT